MRPPLTTTLNSKTFMEYYYLKEELISFCKEHKLQATGSKIEITKRIAYYLDTGKALLNTSKSKAKEVETTISLTSIIPSPITFSETKRAFFISHIGPSFHFNVLFQKWLKNNAGKTYQDAITAYYDILEAKKTKRVSIDKQFEYNTYIRDFFDENEGRTLKEAIQCWKYKKSLPGTNKYEKSDIEILLHDS